MPLREGVWDRVRVQDGQHPHTTSSQESSFKATVVKYFSLKCPYPVKEQTDKKKNKNYVSVRHGDTCL